METGAYAKAAKWEYQAAQAGWGRYESMLAEHGLKPSGAAIAG